MPAEQWLEAVEDCVDRAAESQPVSAAALEVAANHLDQFRSGAPLDAKNLPRLELLRRKLFTLQALARHGLAFHIGLEQLDQTSVVGYTPTGLERALY
jgi:hypothetical protein